LYVLSDECLEMSFFEWFKGHPQCVQFDAKMLGCQNMFWSCRKMPAEQSRN
jgi:hypothetical protein